MTMRNVDKIKKLEKENAELTKEIRKLQAYSESRVQMIHELLDAIEGYKECMQVYEAYISYLIGLQAHLLDENESGEIRIPREEISRLLKEKHNHMRRDGDDYILKVVDRNEGVRASGSGDDLGNVSKGPLS